jgi:hypothetical protein
MEGRAPSRLRQSRSEWPLKVGWAMLIAAMETALRDLAQRKAIVPARSGRGRAFVRHVFGDVRGAARVRLSFGSRSPRRTRHCRSQAIGRHGGDHGLKVIVPQAWDSRQLKAVRQRIAIVDEDRVVSNDVGPAGHARANRSIGSDAPF